MRRGHASRHPRPARAAPPGSKGGSQSSGGAPPPMTTASCLPGRSISSRDARSIAAANGVSSPLLAYSSWFRSSCRWPASCRVATFRRVWSILCCRDREITAIGEGRLFCQRVRCEEHPGPRQATARIWLRSTLWGPQPQGLRAAIGNRHRLRHYLFRYGQVLTATAKRKYLLGELMPRHRDKVVLASKAGILPRQNPLSKKIYDKVSRIARKVPSLQRLIQSRFPPRANLGCSASPSCGAASRRACAH